ncbi:MAG: hypothetical protein DELT_03226 [Desulfovibrio sp.]
MGRHTRAHPCVPVQKGNQQVDQEKKRTAESGGRKHVPQENRPQIKLARALCKHNQRHYQFLNHIAARANNENMKRIEFLHPVRRNACYRRGNRIGKRVHPQRRGKHHVHQQSCRRRENNRRYAFFNQYEREHNQQYNIDLDAEARKVERCTEHRARQNRTEDAQQDKNHISHAITPAAARCLPAARTGQASQPRRPLRCR